jgi:hypothetical protein
VLVVSLGGASITPVTFDELLEPFPDTTQEAARRLRDTALTLIPDAVESCEGGDYGVGTAPGYKGLVFVISRRSAASDSGSRVARASTIRTG